MASTMVERSEWLTCFLGPLWTAKQRFLLHMPGVLTAACRVPGWGRLWRVACPPAARDLGQPGRKAAVCPVAALGPAQRSHQTQWWEREASGKIFQREGV